MLWTSEPGPALPEERESAFRLLLSHCSADQLPSRLDAALRMFQTGEMNPDGLLVLRGPEGLTGAVAVTVVAGGTGIVWPPRALEGREKTLGEDALTRAALHWLKKQGARLSQALLAPDEAFLAAPLLRQGFQRITSLWYLGRMRELTAELLDEVPRLRYETSAAVDPELFRTTLARTFEGTLDCPEVIGARSAEEVLLGFRAQGVFDPAAWWLAWNGTEPVGVLLTNGVAEETAWEISYLGIVPSARGKGFGRELVLKALMEGSAAEVEQLFLTVDERNGPAWRIYRSLGFEPFDRREVFLFREFCAS
jgi:mycothiol synthase